MFQECEVAAEHGAEHGAEASTCATSSALAAASAQEVARQLQAAGELATEGQCRFGGFLQHISTKRLMHVSLCILPSGSTSMFITCG